MEVFVDITLNVLNFFYAIGWHNYGIAIILLTVATKIALYPLTLQSIQQMSAMQKVQPKFEELKKKHKDKPEKFQQEIMKLYKEHGVNPLGGCLPMLLQIPVFIALFVALNSPQFKEMVMASGASSTFLWITNLSLKDPIFIMPVLIAATTFWSQKTMPAAGGNDQMKNVMLIMPFFIGFISIEFPSGVQLYWVVQNLLTVAQQVYIVGKKGKV